MTGERVVGVGEASGIFPIDSETNTYFADMIAKLTRQSQTKHIHGKHSMFCRTF